LARKRSSLIPNWLLPVRPMTTVGDPGAAFRACFSQLVEIAGMSRHRNGHHHPGVMRIGAHLAWADFNDPLQEEMLAMTNMSADEAVMLVLVEPQPPVHAHLVEMASPFLNVEVDQAAGCAVDKNVTFYSLRPPNATKDPLASTQLSSMSRDRVEGLLHNHRAAGSHIIDETLVPCYTVPTLLRRHKLLAGNLVALTVDAEGYDLDILDAVPWDDIAPPLLMWEAERYKPFPSRSRFKQCMQLTNRTRTFIRRMEDEHGYSCAPAEETIFMENVVCVAKTVVPTECASFVEVAQRRWDAQRNGTYAAQLAPPCRW